ncbi:DUF1275 domain protein [Talaromyces stipitatus ATCC 10500]|uniref:DUF1275 domain protein n=1 Tax=Talaromyces stipitatus (strain ATCC 10500 / CBS 375.48 / QM 6759 / NRRL 1006) TaxID=441959 RepID=B8MRF6_TALSN|nr:DUF1275 domain protein [Talaromyces stipitatus ATCC 10500]EED13093.1 DUF1275 domain protein [Talaromyces stipitatus ATCC 10500]
MAQPGAFDQKLESRTAPGNHNNATPAPVTPLENARNQGEDLEASLPTANNPNGNLSKEDDDQILQQKSARRGRWGEIVSTNHADLIFILCSLTTGLCDGVVYASFGCFISMQTGNTIFVGLGASGIPTNKPYGWLKSLISITGFFTGSFVFAKIMRAVGNRKRGALTICFAAQAIFIFIAAAVIEDNQPTSGSLFLELIPIALLAFQFGGQITASRGMGFNELPTVVLTSVYFDIASDPKLTDGVTKNVKRNRRIGSAVAILVGAIAAGWLCRSDAEMQSALWISGFLKVCIAVGWTVWPVAEKTYQTNENENDVPRPDDGENWGSPGLLLK